MLNVGFVVEGVLQELGKDSHAIVVTGGHRFTTDVHEAYLSIGDECEWGCLLALARIAFFEPQLLAVSLVRDRDAHHSDPEE